MIAETTRTDPAPCDYCARADFAPLFTNVEDRLRFVPGKWGFLRCNGCGSAQLSPRPKVADLAAFYPPVYMFAADQDEAQASAGRKAMGKLQHRLMYGPMFAAQVRRVLSGIGGAQAGGRMLDVGCGRGLRLQAFRERGYDVHGMDFDPEVVEYVRRRHGVPAVATDFDGLRQAYPAGSFDLITAFSVMEHVLDVVGTLRTCHDLLRPGGWVVALVPLVDSVQAGVLKSRWAGTTEAPRHVTLPSQAGMRAAMARAGFETVLFRPDTVLNNAAYWALSLVPGVTPTHQQKRGVVRRLLTSGVAAGLAALALPWALVESHLIGRPAHGLFFARRSPQPHPVLPAPKRVGVVEAEKELMG